MKKTSLYEQHLKLNAKMIEYANYHMPVYYQGINEEHLAVRENFGIFDVSHMGEIFIEGTDALRFTNELVTNLISNDYQKVTYALMLNDDGYVVDDCLVYVMKETKILLVVNASNKDKDYAWILSKCQNYDVHILDQSNNFSQIAIQGPHALEKMRDIMKQDVPNLSFMTYEIIKFQDQEMILSRTGYTGEDGFEVYGSHEVIQTLFDRSIQLGATPCGLGSRDTLRFEANLPLFGHEISEDIHPIEAGLNFALKFEKSFIGKDALLNKKENLTRKIVGLSLLEKGIPRQGYEVFAGDQKVGFITTGYMLPTQEQPIALAMVDIEHSKINTELFVQIRKNKVPAIVRNKKFHIKNYKK
jgi:aminomethyltransferase